MKRALAILAVLALAAVPGASAADDWYLTPTGVASIVEAYHGPVGTSFLVLSDTCKGSGASRPSPYPADQEGVDHSPQFHSFVCDLVTNKGRFTYRIDLTQKDSSCKSGYCVHYTKVGGGTSAAWVPPAGFETWEGPGTGKGVVADRPTNCPTTSGAGTGLCWAYLVVAQKGCPHGVAVGVKLIKNGRVVGSGKDTERAARERQVFVHGTIPGRHPGAISHLAAINCS